MKKLFTTALIVLAITTAFAKGPKNQYVRIHTSYGDCIVRLYNETPKHRDNFIKLVKQGFYNGTLFHRVIQNFMIQGGDPDSKKAAPGQMLGQGGPGYTIPAEINPKFFHEKGALAAARLSDEQNPGKASSGSQFYIVQGSPVNEEELKMDPQKFQTMMMTFFQNPANKPYLDTVQSFITAQDRAGYESYMKEIKKKAEDQTGMKADREVAPEKLKAYATNGGTPQLDDQYTVFGKVIKGLEVIDKITAQATDRSNRPTKDIRMTVTIEDVPVSQIEKLYGYKVPEPPATKK